MRLLFSLMLFFGVTAVSAQWSVGMETGVGFSNFNEVQVPNETGTFFDLAQDFSQDGILLPFRLVPSYTFGDRNHISGLFSILSIDYEGNIPFEIDFAGANFTEDQGLALGFYQFNSYRITYRRDFISSEHWILGLGATAKFRDATIRLSTENTQGRKDDFGFVPLINFYLEYMQESWSFLLEGDGLVSGQGRAFDFFGGFVFKTVDNFGFKVGFRVLDGGADVDDVYNFTRIHFAALGLRFHF